MQKILQGKKVVGIKLTHIKKGSIPITEDHHPLQMVTLKHPKGTYLKAHVHVPKKRVTARLQEAIFVKKGKIRLFLYGEDRKLFKSIYLSAGQVFVLLEGGYGIQLIEDTEAVEFKNGPFLEDKLLIE